MNGGENKMKGKKEPNWEENQRQQEREEREEKVNPIENIMTVLANEPPAEAKAEIRRIIREYETGIRASFRKAGRITLDLKSEGSMERCMRKMVQLSGGMTIKKLTGRGRIIVFPHFTEKKRLGQGKMMLKITAPSGIHEFTYRKDKEFGICVIKAVTK